jgi:hypothetical protein
MSSPRSVASEEQKPTKQPFKEGQKFPVPVKVRSEFIVFLDFKVLIFLFLFPSIKIVFSILNIFTFYSFIMKI